MILRAHPFLNCGADFSQQRAAEYDEMSVGVGRDRRQSDRRRLSDRLAGPFETLVRLRHSSGVKRQVTAVVENVSGDGAFVRTTETIGPGERVFLVFRLSETGQTGPQVAARGRVVRAERQPDGHVGIAVHFSSHRFL